MFISNDGECNPHGCVQPFKVRRPWCRVRFAYFNEGPSQTQESHRDQTDVNAIVERFRRTGELPPAVREGFYDDVTALQGDLTDMIESSRANVATAQEFARNWSAPAPAAVGDPPPVDPPPAPAPVDPAP